MLLRLWNTGCQLDAYMLRNSTTRKHTKHRLICRGCYNFKWLSQRPLLREKQWGDKKKLAPTLAATFGTACCSCWWCEVDDGILQITKREVAVEVQGRKLCCCWSLGARIVACIFTIITAHCSTIQDNGTAISLHHPFWICSTECTCNITVLLLGYFALETNRFS